MSCLASSRQAGLSCRPFGRRLDGLDLSAGRVIQDSNPYGFLEVPSLRLEREDLSVQGPLLWSALCPSSTDQGFRCPSCMSACPRDSFRQVPRQLADSCRLQGQIVGGSTTGSSFFTNNLGILINLGKSELTPSQNPQYLSMVLVSRSPRAFPL